MIAALLALTLSAPCGVPTPRGGAPWKTGEQLGFDIDVMGVVKAGTMSLTVGAPQFKGTVIPVRAKVVNTSVFAKVRRVNGLALSWISSRTMKPEHYREEIVEDEVHKVTDAWPAKFADKAELPVDWEYGEEKGTYRFARQAVVLDLVSAIFYLRAVELRPGEALCFDLVANRRLWRLEGTVAQKREKVETEAGVFDTLRLDGMASRADEPSVKRPIHIWMSTDARRLPIAAVSEIDLGPVRAMLARVGDGAGEPAKKE